MSGDGVPAWMVKVVGQEEVATMLLEKAPCSIKLPGRQVAVSIFSLVPNPAFAGKHNVQLTRHLTQDEEAVNARLASMKKKASQAKKASGSKGKGTGKGKRKGSSADIPARVKHLLL
jgi:hypothetical protein